MTGSKERNSISATVTLTATDDGDVSIIFPNDENMTFDSSSNNADGVSFIRFHDLFGDEIVGWTSDEWREAPEEVMGAILGKLCECLKGEK